MAAAIEPLIYTPAKRGNTAVLIMLSGPSGSGKTLTALRLATGLAQGGLIGLCDTEHGRALYYAPQPGEEAHPPETFAFQHLPLKEPFSPDRFEAAAVTSQKAGHAVWVCDSFSHEHVGPGGILDMQEAELQRMAGDDYAKRDTMKYTAWIRPKGMHKHLVQRLWQLNCHIILCCHAEKKLDLIKNDKGKNVPNPDRGMSPVCAPDIPYAMTVSFLLDPKNPGVPIWLKYFDKLASFIHTDRVLDEETGRRIAEWSKGKRTESAPATTAAPAKPAAADKPPAEPQESTPPPPDEEDKAAIIAAGLVAEYNATTDTKSHFALVDDATKHKQVEWLKRKRKDLFKTVNAAVAESWGRVQIPADSEPAEQQKALL